MYFNSLQEWEESEQHDDQSDEDKKSSQDNMGVCKRVKNAIQKLKDKDVKQKLKDDAIKKLKDAAIYILK